MTRGTGARHSGSQSEFDFIAELDNAGQSPDCSGHAAIPGRVLQEIARLADSKGSRARAAIEDVLWLKCDAILGATARRRFAEQFIAERAERVREFLAGLGLSRGSEEADAYAPGAWSLAEERRGRGRTFVISGIRAPSGGSVSVRLKVREFNSPAQVWRAIQEVIGSGDYPPPGASLWRRLWRGFTYTDAAGLCRRAAGIREGLLAESADHHAKESGVPPRAIAGGLLPSCAQASPRLQKQKTRPRLEPRTGSFVDADERPRATPIVAWGLVAVNHPGTRSSHDSRDEFLPDSPR